MSKWLVLGLLSLVGCGRLSKEGAKEVLEKVYAADPSANCVVQVNKLDDGYEAASGGNNTKACAAAMHALGAITKPSCEKSSCTFEPTKQAKAETSSLTFPCGTRRLVEILSVSTEGKKARVSYRRNVELDAKAQAVLDNCLVHLDVPAGESKKSTTLVRDDEGVWRSEGY